MKTDDINEKIEEAMEYIQNDTAKAIKIFDEILETRAGGVISSHCGPGTLGVLFMAGE